MTRRVGLDVEKARLKRAEWRAANSEKVNGYSAKYRAANLEKVREATRNYSRANKPRRKHNHLVARYDISLSDYEQMHASQNGQCAICALERKLYVDHNHATKKVRGLLCMNCNMGIGYLKEKLGNLERAATYLRFWADEAIEEG